MSRARKRAQGWLPHEPVRNPRAPALAALRPPNFPLPPALADFPRGAAFRLGLGTPAPPSGCDIFTHSEMEFDRYTIALLLLRTDAPAFTEMEEAELQDAHMSHLSDLHDNGYLLAAGPVLGPPNRELRGFSILNVDAERARELKQQDPAVRAGKYRIEVFPWLLPAGLIAFSAGHLPRSIAEAED